MIRDFLSIKWCRSPQKELILSKFAPGSCRAWYNWRGLNNNYDWKGELFVDEFLDEIEKNLSASNEAAKNVKLWVNLFAVM